MMWGSWWPWASSTVSLGVWWPSLSWVYRVSTLRGRMLCPRLPCRPSSWGPRPDCEEAPGPWWGCGVSRLSIPSLAFPRAISCWSPGAGQHLWGLPEHVLRVIPSQPRAQGFSVWGGSWTTALWLALVSPAPPGRASSSLGQAKSSLWVIAAWLLPFLPFMLIDFCNNEQL